MQATLSGLLTVHVLPYTLSLNFLIYPVHAFQFNLNTVLFTQRTVIEPMDQTGSLMMLSPPLLTLA